MFDYNKKNSETVTVKSDKLSKVVILRTIHKRISIKAENYPDHNQSLLSQLFFIS